MSGYKELQVWHRAMDLAALVYDVARGMPKSEQFGMISQLTRAAASVPDPRPHSATPNHL
jgi:hypothetical protein